MNLSTVDGFDIQTVAKDDRCPADKVSALTSTIYAMGEAVTEQLTTGLLNAVIVEADKGHVLFVKNKHLSQDTVLAVAYSHKTSLGEARFLTKRLADQISQQASS